MMLYMVKLICLGYIITVVAAKDPTLKISPAPSVQTIPVGKNVLLTCQPDVDDRNLVTQLEWRDPQDRVIDENYIGKHRITKEVMPEGVLALIIHTFQETDAGNYTCSGYYANNMRLTKSVRLESIYAIKFENAPTEQYPIINQDYKVKCKVSANPAPHVDWSKNGEPIQFGGRYVVQPDGLLIQKASETDDGTYNCRAIVIETGELAEKLIKVEVHTPPYFKEMNDTYEIVEGEQANIVCKASGKPQPSYSWIKRDTLENVAKKDRFRVNEREGSMTITSVSENDYGEYKCVASNAAANIERYFNLIVIVKPKIAEITNITVPIQREARLECKARGRPPPDVTFRKYTSKQRMVEGVQPWDARIVIERKVNSRDAEVITTLVIRNLNRNDDGLYECIASNKGGDAFKPGHITVEFPPVFDPSQQSVYWTWGQRPANLTCLAEAIPNATITWRRNDQLIDARTPLTGIVQQGKGPSSSLIILPNVYNFGYYKCIANNPFGEAEFVIQLKEAKVPGEVLQSQIESATATTVKFRLVRPQYDGGIPLQALAVQYKERQRSWQDAYNKTWPLDAPFIVENLQPQRTYDFRFAARNDVGLGIWGAPQHMIMPQRSAPGIPAILLSQNLNGVLHSQHDTKYDLQWQIPADNGEPIDMYEIKHCKVSQDRFGHWEIVESCDTKSLYNGDHRGTSYSIKELRPDTHYKVELRAHNQIGYSEPAEVVIKTARDPSNKSSAMPTLSTRGLSWSFPFLVLIFSLISH